MKRRPPAQRGQRGIVELNAAAPATGPLRNIGGRGRPGSNGPASATAARCARSE